MRQQKKPSPTRNNLRPIFIFCAVVFLVITTSLLFKLSVLIKDSKVDKADTFTVLFVYKDDVDIVTLSSNEKKLSHLKIIGKGTVEDKLHASGILPDDKLVLKNTFEGYTMTSSYFYDAALHKKGIKTTLSFYDLMRLALQSKSVTTSSMDTKSIRLPVDENVIDALVVKMLKDQSFIQDNKTISIVNATGLVGVGTKFGRIFSNMGLTVVSVTNGEKIQENSDISYYGDKSYTTSRLSSLLMINPKNNTMLGLSDIILTLGKDKSDIYK